MKTIRLLQQMRRDGCPHGCSDYSCPYYRRIMVLLREAGGGEAVPLPDDDDGDYDLVSGDLPNALPGEGGIDWDEEDEG